MAEKNVVIDIRGLTKRFGGITAVNNVDIAVEKGQIFGIIGPNGAGKTTIFNMITGIYLPTEGDIQFLGKTIVGNKPHVINDGGIARTFQNIRLFGELSVYMNVLTAYHMSTNYNTLQGFLRTPKCRAEEKRLSEMTLTSLEEVGLLDLKDQPANSLPYGKQRRLEIARALATKPQLLLLDEPAAGMNEEESKNLNKFIFEVREKHDVTIIIIDHHMDVIMELCDRIAVLNFGSKLAEGNPEEIQNNDEVVAAYLGVDE
ncbi:ABC transporter ATP-binding protein [Oscillospiraceae bacterium OttesenSCG-928-G22]|nr:ABC transporter ATP-binding protein [Oscillospiraceae bacterium OttesenSCG-928-G22]